MSNILREQTHFATWMAGRQTLASLTAIAKDLNALPECKGAVTSSLVSKLEEAEGHMLRNTEDSLNDANMLISLAGNEIQTLRNALSRKFASYLKSQGFTVHGLEETDSEVEIPLYYLLSYSAVDAFNATLYLLDAVRDTRRKCFGQPEGWGCYVAHRCMTEGRDPCGLLNGPGSETKVIHLDAENLSPRIKEELDAILRQIEHPEGEE